MIPELKEAIMNEDVDFLSKYLFPKIQAAQNLTENQQRIIKKIAFGTSKRLSISAYTRYGKTQCVAIGVALYILFNEKKKIKFIAPTIDQAAIIRNYMSELILSCDLLLSIAEIEVSGLERIKKEATKNRMTFKNGCEYQIISAHGEGFASMGHGGDLIVIDEAALIKREAYAKITRMLGDDPENSVLIELYNPWDRDTKAFDHSISPRFERIQIDYKIGILEGRTTEIYITEQKEEITPIEFTVLYESRFPEEAVDSIFKLSDIEKAENQSFKLEDELKILTDKMAHPEKMTESEYSKLKKEAEQFTKIISCDPADKGLDWTVIHWGIQKNNQFQLIGTYSEPISDPMRIVGKIWDIANDFIESSIKGIVKLDRIGIGVGPLSRLKEKVNEENKSNITIQGCHFGESAIKSDNFQNKKAENYFRLNSILNEGLIDLSCLKKRENFNFEQHIKKELLAEKWEFTSSSNKKKIVDPDKSPDYADALVYFIWRDNTSLAFAFV